jgi:Domain of unknown function (DUF4862)
MNRGIFVGAYAASPCHTEWMPAVEERYLTSLAQDSRIRGLELPYFEAVHRWDERWLFDHLPRHWDIVLTLIPGTMARLKNDPVFGLASADGGGRQRALEHLRAVRDAVDRLNSALGRDAVRAVEVHSAPALGQGVLSSVQGFRNSLAEAASWDWRGARLLVEHCDAFLPGQDPAKGFMTLEQEIMAIDCLPAALRARLGVLINWGRSAIEGRSVEVPLRHLEQAKQSGLLGGLIFSGVTEGDALYGNWADSHAPFGAPSLLTDKEVRLCLEALGSAEDAVLGFKIQALPKTLSVEERLELVRSWLSFLEQRLPIERA